MIPFTKFICVLLTYLIESWISPGYSYEINVLYVQQENSQDFLYYNTLLQHFQEQK